MFVAAIVFEILIHSNQHRARAVIGTSTLNVYAWAPQGLTTCRQETCMFIRWYSAQYNASSLVPRPPQALNHGFGFKSGLVLVDLVPSSLCQVDAIVIGRHFNLTMARYIYKTSRSGLVSQILDKEGSRDSGSMAPYV